MRYRNAFRYTVCGLHAFTTNVHMLFYFFFMDISPLEVI